MSDGWGLSDDDVDAWLEEWQAVDQAAADYLAERIPEVRDSGGEDRRDWVAEIGETISASEAPDADEVEVVSAVMALQQADWLGLALGVVGRGPGGVLDENMQFTERGVWGLPRALYRIWSATP